MRPRCGHRRGSVTSQALKRFEAKYVPVTESGCWLWIGCTTSAGYGRFNAGDGTKNAHTIALGHWRGVSIPKGFHTDHLCRVRCCVNPDHLEVVTPAENLKRGSGFSAVHMQRTHCPKGHPYEGTNCIHEVDRNYPRRRCRICKSARQYAYNRRVRGKL